MSSRTIGNTCWILTLVFPLCLFAAETNAAMLSAKGVVRVNGSVLRAGVVYAGDQITTEPEATANLLTRGASISLPPNSSITYRTGQVEIGAGRVVVSVTASSGMKGRIGNLTVAPLGRSARFQLASAGGKLSVAALEGALRVSDGTGSMVLATGKMMTSTAPAAAGAPAPGSASAAAGIPGWVVGVIVAGTAASAMVGGMAATGAFDNPSPSQMP